MSNKLLHGYKKFLRNSYDLRRILRETRQLLEDLVSPNILPGGKHQNFMMEIFIK